MRPAISSASVLLAAMWLTPVVAAAQGLISQPRVELGGAIGGIVSSDGTQPSYGPRVTVNLTDRAALEYAFEVNRIEHMSMGSVVGASYLTQFNYAVRPGSASLPRVFVLAGVLGLFEHERYAGVHIALPGGQVIASPPRTYNAMTWPFVPTIGVGAQREIGRHVAIRTEAQGMFSEYGAAVRGSISISIPIGHYGQ